MAQQKWKRISTKLTPPSTKSSKNKIVYITANMGRISNPDHIANKFNEFITTIVYDITNNLPSPFLPTDLLQGGSSPSSSLHLHSASPSEIQKMIQNLCNASHVNDQVDCFRFHICSFSLLKNNFFEERQFYFLWCLHRHNISFRLDFWQYAQTLRTVLDIWYYNTWGHRGLEYSFQLSMAPEE